MILRSVKVDLLAEKLVDGTLAWRSVEWGIWADGEPPPSNARFCLVEAHWPGKHGLTVTQLEHAFSGDATLQDVLQLDEHCDLCWNARPAPGFKWPDDDLDEEQRQRLRHYRRSGSIAGRVAPDRCAPPRTPLRLPPLLLV